MVHNQNNILFFSLNNNAIDALLSWYRNNARDLPWRKNISPYRVWISEIMLQQTRVEAVKPYFKRFLEAFPDIEALAKADETLLLKMWEGLGYYSRARNLKKAAIQIKEQFNGQLPSDYQKLLKLKGIGNYTAGAIASIAYGIPAPAVDGNVLRVMSRLSDCHADITLPKTKRQAEAIALKMCPQNSASDFTQAMIELGATVCVPNGEAKCNLCPLRQYCSAFSNNTVDLLPIRVKKKPRRIEKRTVLLLRDGDRYMIRRRPSKGLLAGLYELPNELGELTREQAISFARKNGFQPLHTEQLAEAKHIFTHIEWHMNAYLMTGYFEDAENRIMATSDELSDLYAIPSAFSEYTKMILKQKGSI